MLQFMALDGNCRTALAVRFDIFKESSYKKYIAYRTSIFSNYSTAPWSFILWQYRRGPEEKPRKIFEIFIPEIAGNAPNFMN